MTLKNSNHPTVTLARYAEMAIATLSLILLVTLARYAKMAIATLSLILLVTLARYPELAIATLSLILLALSSFNTSNLSQYEPP